MIMPPKRSRAALTKVEGAPVKKKPAPVAKLFGLHPDDLRARKKRNDAQPMFEGENHGVVWVPGSGFERTNYMGPGTNIMERIKRGDQGKTPIDQISKLHDIDYSLAGMAKSDKEQEILARKADERMISSGWKAYREGKENLFNLTEGAGLIKAKNILEDWGILNPRKFLSKRTFDYGAGASTRDASEYEILIRARSELVCGGGATGDSGECSKTNEEISENL
jgi:hypothetical protein